MRIALISTEKLPVPAVAGGAVQLYIESVLPYLSKHHDITVFSKDYLSLPQDEEKDGVKYIRVTASNEAEYVSNIKSKLTDDFDLVHVFNRPAWIAELGSVLPNTKFSLSLHNEMFTTKKLSASRAKECISRVEFINTVSRYIADGVEFLYPEAESKLKIIYSGADPEKYKPSWTIEASANKKRLQKKYQIEGSRVVLFVGRLSVKKGVHVLLRAMKKVMDMNPDVALVIIGSKWYGENKSDEYTKSLEVMSKSLPGPIVFTGFLPPSEVIGHYNLGDIFICPSQWNEPLARVHYEAMAAGLPIITTNRGGNGEVVSGKGNGLVVDDYSNPDALAESISYLLNKPDAIREMGKAGRTLAEKTYNWERVAEDLLKAFNHVESGLEVKLPESVEIPIEILPPNSEDEALMETKPDEEILKEIKPEEEAPQPEPRKKTESGERNKPKWLDFALFSHSYRVHLLGYSTHSRAYRNILWDWNY